MVFGKRPGKFSLVHFKWKTSHWVIKIKFKLLKIINPPVKEEVTFNWHWVGATLIETLFVSCRPSFSPGVSWGREKILEKGDKISRVFNGLWSLSEIILAMEMLTHSRIEGEAHNVHKVTKRGSNAEIRRLKRSGGIKAIHAFSGGIEIEDWFAPLTEAQTIWVKKKERILIIFVEIPIPFRVKFESYWEGFVGGIDKLIKLW